MNKGVGMMMAMGAMLYSKMSAYDIDLPAQGKGKQYWFDRAYGQDVEKTGEYYRDNRGCLRKRKDSETVI